MIGLALGVFVVALTVTVVLTGGADAGLATAALIGAGLAMASYSVQNRSATGLRFWGGYVASAAVGAVVGVATAGIGDVVSGGVDSALEDMTSGFVKAATKGLLEGGAGMLSTGTGDLVQQLASNVIDRDILGENVSMSNDVLRSLLTGMVFGAAGGLASGAAEGTLYKTTFGDEALDSEPIELKSLGNESGAPTVDEESGTNYGFEQHETKTPAAKAVVYGINQAANIGGSSVEAAGY